ncbi:DUF2179 domain-containing protein [Mycoplasma enhydrae]|uniref:DUF2179 domain-containing protein n=1 Tax=Mycoplasma enhydrae TaxID=2499220 RepID=UPI00197B498C|nr:DUF2179 domain-containing protein [Mycoplasma enhydrae]MBN4089443.1 YitT family protein [Mycoplasma enhydrae]MCV3733499.1 DUF2179 domain-containing protein [Mycoplasma enhydrae]MCV3753253.1 DUF2179 domain-containing protein [Mycoplasma enhydrae]
MKKNDKNKIMQEQKVIRRAKVKQSLLRFGSMYRIKNTNIQILLTILIGLLFGTTQYFFIQITGLYEMGIAAICQAIARFTNYFLVVGSVASANIVYNLIFWLLNLFANIPLFVLSYKKISKKFAILTIIFMVAVSISGLIVSNIPGTSQLMIFGGNNADTLPIGKAIHNSGFVSEHGLLTWLNIKPSGYAIFFYALVWGALQGIFTWLLLIIDGCSGGFDMLSVYLSHKKYKDVGGILMMLHLVSFLIANFFGSYMPFALQEKNWNLQNYFSPSFVAGLFMVLFNGWLLSILFPKFKMVKVEVISSKLELILENINSLTTHKFQTSIHNFIGGYSKAEQKSLVVVCMFLDAAILNDIITKHDPNALVVVTELKKVDGYIFVTH